MSVLDLGSALHCVVGHPEGGLFFASLLGAETVDPNGNEYQLTG